MVLKTDQRLALLALLSCWILFLLTPFIFSYDMGEILKNVETHTDINEYRLVNIIFFTFLWITYSNLIDEIFPARIKIIFSLELAVLVTTIGRVFLYDNYIEAELFLSGVLAILIMRSGAFKVMRPYKLTAIILAVAMFYNSLYPFEFFESPFKVFNWVPFSELFSSNILSTVRTVFYKIFIYGSILWNFYKGFPNTRYITIMCVIYACTIEYFQHMTFARIGGLTEPFIVFCVSIFIEQKKELKEKFQLYD